MNTTASDQPMAWPIEKSNPAVRIWEEGLNKTIIKILNDSHVDWETCSLYRYGVDPDMLDSCPPTIVVRCSNPQEPIWTATAAKIRSAMDAAKMQAKFQALQGVVANATTSAWQVPNPYNNPRHLGESCSIHDGPLSGRADGTMGGCLKLHKGSESKLVGLTNNHVVNVQPDGTHYDIVSHRSVVSPSDNDHSGSKVPAVWLPAARELAKYAALNPDQQDPQKLIGNLCDALTAKTPVASSSHPSSSDIAIAKEWEVFTAAWKERKIADVNVSVTALDKMTFPPTFDVKKDIDLLHQLLITWSAHQKAYDAYVAVDENQKRWVGKVFAASGLRASDANPANDPCVLDWALVEIDTASKQFVNESPDLKEFATAVFQGDKTKVKGSKYLDGVAGKITEMNTLKITEFGQLQPNGVVFKVGRTSGCTAGIVNGASSEYHASKKIGAGFPFPKDGLTKEWDVMTVKTLTRTGTGWPPPFLSEGDSGSWIIDTEGRLVALGWGVTKQLIVKGATECHVTRIEKVLESIKQVTGGWEATLPA